ncbi:phosphatidylinositol phosphatase PTPRQ-like isoform X2 [Corticium candelabrum]|uniref:phosphatidylinositol phosphatase PTPRQ-like isoform X2 n=1 Tax=Corticium candelabrum TaxID=121492 RepID=UPI002E263148|nr:phosphatidylinositol phosphatase PTPRQ-like isoform X2 [Corticium candelabrum]
MYLFRWCVCLWYLCYIWSSRVSCVRTDNCSPGQPCERPNVTNVTTSKIYISMSCPSADCDCKATKYWPGLRRLYFTPESIIRTTTEKTFAFTHLHPHTFYALNVTATYNQDCAKGFNSSSEIVVVITRAAALPTPKIVQVKPRDSQSAKIQVNVNDGYKNISSFMVYYNGTNTPFNTTNSTKILLTGLTPYTAYEVRVAAVFRPLGASDSSYDVRSNMSNAMDFVTLRPKPSIPLDVLVDEGSLTASSAKIVWTAPATPNGLIAYYTVSYVIGQFSVANTSSAVKTLKGADKNLNFTLENLNSCSWYTTWVQATKEEKGKLLESDTSTVATFKTLASATEPARNVTIEKTGATNATISWSSPSCNATKPLKNYKIFLESNKTAIQPDINQPKMDISNLSSSVVLRSLMPLRTYYVWVAAIYENSTTGESITKTSKPKTFQTLPPSSSSPPLNVGASNVTSSSVVVTWSRPKDVFGIIAKYDVSIHSLETNSRARRSKKILEVNGQDNSIFIASLHPYTKYTAKVRAGTEIPANSSHYLWSNSNSNNFTTDVSEPPVPRNLSIASNLTKDYGGKVLITIPGIDNTNGPIDAVEIIVVELKSGVVWSYDKPLPKNKTDGVVTITAFTIPSNKTDQTILTGAKTSKIPMLKAGTSYAFYLRWTVENSTRKLTSTSKATIYSTKPIPTELVTVATPSPTFLLSSSPSTLTPSSSPASTSTASSSSASTSTASASSSVSSTSTTTASSSSASTSTASCVLRATTSPPARSDEKKNVGLLIAGVGTLSFGAILLVLAVYFFYQRKRLVDVGGENECNTMEIEMDEQEETHRAIEYEAVLVPAYLPDVLTTNPGYAKSSVGNNPAYNVAVINNQDDRQ